MAITGGGCEEEDQGLFVLVRSCAMLFDFLQREQRQVDVAWVLHRYEYERLEKKP